MNFRKWLEALHAYDKPDDWETQFQPLKKGDTFRVFHGFHSFTDAYRAAHYGLTGREKADRRYSYEFDNNPHGLFVTLNHKKAAYFGSTIMEFIAREEDLEAPVWPGGSYTVQGGREQYFGHGRQGKIKRMQRKKVAQGETENFLKRQPNHYHHIRQSDDKYKAKLLFMDEFQGLFVGDLNPQDIVAFYIWESNQLASFPFTKLTRAEFLEKYKDYKDEPSNPKDYSWPRPPDRIFLPGEEFEPNKFLQGIKDKFDQDPNELLKDIWQHGVARSPKDKKWAFIDSFKSLIWPKQYAKAMLFMKNRYGKGEE